MKWLIYRNPYSFILINEKVNFKTLDKLKNELLQNQRHQLKQQPVILELKEIKAKLNDLEKHNRRNNLRIDWIIEEKTSN